MKMSETCVTFVIV